MEGLSRSPPAMMKTRRRLLSFCAATVAAVSAPSVAMAKCGQDSGNSRPRPLPGARVLQVGRGGPLPTLSAAAAVARDGDVIEVAPGDYVGDVAVWRQSDLVIEGLRKRPRLIADGRSAEDKAIFVVRGDRVRISNLEFRGARVRDGNGAGIRQEGRSLSITECSFIDNENGILCGNDPSMELSIVASSFLENGNTAGSAHNLYVGRIASLQVDGCWFGRSKVGHLLKTRAQRSVIRYSRLTGETGTGSYELEFAEGGDCLVLGCLIQQGPQSENATIVAYGAEGYRWSDNQLLLAFNTIVNDRERGGVFLRAFNDPQRVVLAHNLLVGRGSVEAGRSARSIGSVETDRRAFANPDDYDYRLRTDSPLIGRAGFRGQVSSDLPIPTKEYSHPASSCDLEGVTSLTPLSPGAFQRLSAR